MSPLRIACTTVVAGLLAGGPLLAQPRTPAPGPPARVLWHVPGEARGTPVHDDERVYFLSKDREVVALDPATGALRWKSGTGVTSRDDVFGTTTAGVSLALDGATVIAGDWDVVGFDRRTGHRQWTYTAPDGDGPGLFLGPASGGTTYAGSAVGRIYALDSATGRLRWMSAVGEGMITVFPPVVAGEAVYVTFTRFSPKPWGGGIARLDGATGRVEWLAMFPTTVPESGQGADRTGGPVVVDDLVFGAVMDGGIHAYDVRSGAHRWSFPTLTDPFPGYLSEWHLDFRTLVRAGRRIIAGSTTGTVVAYDVGTHAEAWRYDGGYLGAPAFAFSVDDATVYLPYFGGFIVALDVATGRERWRHGDFTVGFIWPPDPARDRVYAAAGQGGYYALTPKTQEPVP